MSKPRTPLDALRALGQIEGLKHQAIPSGGLDPQVAAFRAWQARRLGRTYADLLAHPRYEPACRFFLEDLYGPRDFSQRDHDLNQMHDFLQRFVPEQLTRPLTLTVTLHALTHALDDQMLAVIQRDLGGPGALTVARYAEAYRRCDRYADRRRQIDLIGEIGEELDRIVRLPLISTAIALARGPAVRAGWQELTEFLERGYAAFKHMRGATFFLATIRQRERRSLDKMFAGEADPFGFELTLERDPS